LSDEVVVFFVRADPEADNKITVLLCNRTIVISDSDGPNVADKRLELHRGMKRIALPGSKLVSSEALDVRR